MKKIILTAALFYQVVFSQSSFNVEFDYAAFHYNDTMGYLEIYYSFYQPQFKPVVNDGSLPVISGSLRVIIKDSTENTIVQKDYGFSSNADTSNSRSTSGLTGVLRYALPFGRYSCSLFGSDENSSESSDSAEFKVLIKPLPDERFSISDIELATSIKEADSDSGMFYKNTYEVIPNPANLYGELMPVVYFYTEIYNLNVNTESANLKVEHILYNSSNKVFYKKTRFIPRSVSSIVEAGTVNISKAPSGAYNLIVAATDSIKNLTIYSSKRLYVINPGVVDTQSATGGQGDLLSSEFSTMSEEELNETFGFSKYIATDKEQDQWTKLNSEDAKRKFLFNFWNARDKNTSTPENEYKRGYFERVKLANERYATIQRKGWRTDRGRVLITYGEPDEIERYPNQFDTKPHEIWNYNELDGGVIFVFADTAGFNDYTLIHSTMRGELRDDYWSRKIGT